MRQKSEIEIRRAAMLKTCRSLIRLRYSLAADRELNESLPPTLAAFDAKVANGTMPSVEDHLDDVLGRS